MGVFNGTTEQAVRISSRSLFRSFASTRVGKSKNHGVVKGRVTESGR